MVEKISKALKIIAALSLQLLSVLLIAGLIKLNLSFSFFTILLIAGTAVLVYLFISFSLALLKQLKQNQASVEKHGVLDEYELNKNKSKDGSIL
jgi:hypothetical protein